MSLVATRRVIPGILSPSPGGISVSESSEIYTNLVEWFPLDEASTGNRIGAHNGNIISPKISLINPRTGKVGNGIDCLGDNDCLVDRVGTWWRTNDSNQSFAWCMWIYADAFGAADKPLAPGHDGFGGQFPYQIILNSGISRFYTYNGSSYDIVSWGSTLSTGTWYFVFIWYDQGESKIYISINDGTPVSSACGAPVFTETKLIEFALGGTVQVTGPTFNGVIDEAAFWKNYVPTAEERTWLYNSGSGKGYSDFAAQYG